MSDWIDVKDKLPKQFEEILILMECGRNEKKVFSGCLCNDHEFAVNLPTMEIKSKTLQIRLDFQLWHILEADLHNKITHWQTIPIKETQ